MATNICNACTDNIFTRLSSNPDIAELIAGSVKPVIVKSGDDIMVVDKVETEDDITYFVKFTPYVPLVIQSFVNDLPLQIKGFTVTDYVLDWTYNVPVMVHSLDNGLSAPSVGPAQLIYQLVVGLQNIEDNTTITLTADDNTGDGNVAKEATTSILFGNFLYSGDVTIADTGAYDPSEANIKALTPTLAVNAKGANPITYTNDDVDKYHIFSAPSNSPFIVNNFQDSVNPVPGGFVLVKTLDITNSEGFTEEYTVWRSTFDNTAGTDGAGNPITFSII